MHAPRPAGLHRKRRYCETPNLCEYFVNELTILGISGSLRQRSVNTALLRAANELAPSDVSIVLANIELPLYNGDLDDEAVLAPVRRLNEQIIDADALLFATPEFNYGIPGPLKNAIDWCSRPAFKSPFAGKPVAIVGAAPSAVGTARAQGQIKQNLLGLASLVFPFPEFICGGSSQKFDDELRLVDQRTRDHLASMLEQFVAFTRKWNR